ncbi:RNA polymerase sigma-70 factor [Maribacter sp. 2304DJ31-5]|uniref:RNA polymerase sigma-70 factor n=1 Tax=Maribacter sp. 2304DJ31-5 TaxID=3386273 RepID=UPI0039BD06CF
MSASNDTLLLLLKENNEFAFQQIYNRYWKRLFQIAFSILQNEELAKDAIQDVFVKIWTKRHDLDIKHLEAYLYRAAKLKCFEILRRSKIKQKVLNRFNKITEGNNVDETIDYHDTQDKISRAMQNIPQKSLRVFQMSRNQNLSNKQIAEELDISYKTVEYHISVSLKHLKKVMGFFF